MPRKPVSSPSEIYEALKDFLFTDDEGILLPWSDGVWQKAAEEMDGKMNKDYIYLYISQNRHGVFDRIRGVKKSERSGEDENLNMTTDDSTNHLNDSNWSMGDTDGALPFLRTTVIISKSEWDDLLVVTKTYKQREYEVLLTGWADRVYDILWDHLKLPCPFAFKNAKINRNPGEIYLSIKGSCLECGALIHIYCPNVPDAHDPIFYISTHDSRGIAHTKKRWLRGQKRMRIAKELRGISTYAWRRDEANKKMDFGDLIPSSIPSEDVLRKAKQEGQDKELGLFQVTSVYQSILELKYNKPEFSGCIHEFGLDKFWIMYWTPTQLFLYKKFLKEDETGSISIDATGGIVRQIPSSDGSKRVVFLYQAVCGYRGKILPLFQMISEKHDANILSYCMQEWIRSGAPIPKQAVVDYSLALLNAACLAFNNVNLKSYIRACITYDASGTMKLERPPCILRIDIAHLIKLVARWSCWRHQAKEKKDFYIRCVGLLTECAEIREFQSICTDVATVAFSKYENISDPESRCFAAQYRLMKRVKSFNLPEGLTSSDEESENIDDSAFEFQVIAVPSSAIDDILGKIARDGVDNSSDERLNGYFCSEFGHRFLKLCEHFPLWTAIMTKGEDIASSGKNRVATSARSEEYFRELKHLILNKQKSLRIDKFLVIHLRFLFGTSKLLNATEKKMEKQRPSITRPPPENQVPSIMNSARDVIPSIEGTHNSENGINLEVEISSPDDARPDEENNTIESEELNGVSEEADSTVQSNDRETNLLNEVEDWKGLISKLNSCESEVSIRPKKRGKYLTACPDIEIIHKRPKFISVLPLLENGNRLRPEKIGKQEVSVRNTCAFDSTVQSMLTAYHDFSLYNQYIKDNHNIHLFKFIQALSETGTTRKNYQERASILSTAYKIENGILDGTINISYLQDKFILKDVPSLVKEVRCTDCHSVITKVLPVLHLDRLPIYKKGMAGVQEALDDTYKLRNTTKCFQCRSSNIVRSLKPGSHIMISIEDVSNELLWAQSGLSDCRKEFTVGEIPDKLTYGGFPYKLVSAIIHTANHYFAIIKRVTGKWEVHDDLRRQIASVTARTLYQKHSIHLLFYVCTAHENEAIVN